MKGSSLIFIAVFVVLIYALMIMPQRRQQKQKAEMMRKLGPGAKVMTASGIYAQVVQMHDSIIVAKIAEGVEVEMDSRAVVRVVDGSAVSGANLDSVNSVETDEKDINQES